YLFTNGAAPKISKDTYIRFIHFHFRTADLNQIEVESAFKGFFSDDIVIVWENRNSGTIIEERKEISPSEKDLITMSETLESDFYTKIFFYIRKFHNFFNKLTTHFNREKEYFVFGQKWLPDLNFFTFERVFPAYLTQNLPEGLIEKVN